MTRTKQAAKVTIDAMAVWKPRIDATRARVKPLREKLTEMQKLYRGLPDNDRRKETVDLATEYMEKVADQGLNLDWIELYRKGSKEGEITTPAFWQRQHAKLKKRIDAIQEYLDKLEPRRKREDVKGEKTMEVDEFMFVMGTSEKKTPQTKRRRV